MEISTFEIEKEILLSDANKMIIGVDEAGIGPLAGPVVACATMFKSGNKYEAEDERWNLIRDSKTLSVIQRKKAVDFIFENFDVGVGICDNNTIDRINILEASFLAMKKAIQELKRNVKNSITEKQGSGNWLILIDGNKKIPNFSEQQMTVLKGDRKVKSISAASIVAKITRDKMMLEAHEKYPNYGFDKHKGYGTKFHREALQKCGPCKIHRKSFGPVKKVLYG